MSFDRTMYRHSKPRSGAALGGIGAGWFEIRQDGQTYDWNIFNNKPLGVGAHFTMPTVSMLFFLVRYQVEGFNPKIKLLQIEESHKSAAIEGHEMYYIFPWLSGVDKIEYSSTFPFSRLRFIDKEMPFIVDLEAWSPFIPHNEKDSSLPAALFDFTITSMTNKKVDVSIFATLRNAVGYDDKKRTYKSSAILKDDYAALEMSCEMDKSGYNFGHMGLFSMSPGSSYYLGWEHHHPYYEILLRNKDLPNIDDTDGRNQTDEKTGRKKALERCFSTIGWSTKLNGKKNKINHKLGVTWNFPNLYAEDVRTGKKKKGPYLKDQNEGHYYSNFFSSSYEVSQYVADNYERLSTETEAFHDAFFDSSLEEYALDQINSHLNTFITSSWFSREGYFGILEGLSPEQSWAGLATTDVSMYGGVMIASLFPRLDRNTSLLHAQLQRKDGIVTHSIHKNFKTAAEREVTGVRLDMPSQFVYMALRAFLWSGDMEYLKKVWPHCKKAISYVLSERDKNKDLLPYMEGIMCSYDNFPMHGVASYVAGQWLAAVHCAYSVAEILGDAEALSEYEQVFEKGKAVFEDKVWNGAYYRLYNNEPQKENDKDEGCLTDQMIGQWALHLVNGPRFLRKDRIDKALKSILSLNFYPEYGLRNCQWPGDEFLHDVKDDTWVDQANTVWSGVELEFASFLLYEGFEKEAYEIIKNVDDRYKKWGLYYDHKEFGGHYYRPMSAWGIINAALGLGIKNHNYSFSPKIQGRKIKLFFTFSGGYAHYKRNNKISSETQKITPVRGKLIIHSVTLETIIKPVSIKLKLNGEKYEDFHIDFDKNKVVVQFDSFVTVNNKGLKIDIN